MPAALLLTLALLSGIGFAGVPSDHASPSVPRRLMQESGYTLEILWNPETGTPRMLTGRLTKPSKHSPSWIAYGLLAKAKGLYGLKRVSDELKIVEINKDTPGLVQVRLEHILYGTPVCGDRLVVEIDNDGVVRHVEGTIHAGLEEKRLKRPMVPAVSFGQAAEVASKHLQGVEPAGKAEVNACYLPTREGVPLVYVVTLKDTSGTSHTVRVHSLTGRIIETE